MHLTRSSALVALLSVCGLAQAEVRVEGPVEYCAAATSRSGRLKVYRPSWAPSSVCATAWRTRWLTTSH
jgi:hypothetical protein